MERRHPKQDTYQEPRRPRREWKAGRRVAGIPGRCFKVLSASEECNALEEGLMTKGQSSWQGTNAGEELPSSTPTFLLYSFSRAAITNYHRLGGFNSRSPRSRCQQNLFFLRTVREGSAPGPNSWLVDGRFLPVCSHHPSLCLYPHFLFL